MFPICLARLPSLLPKHHLYFLLPPLAPPHSSCPGGHSLSRTRRDAAPLLVVKLWSMVLSPHHPSCDFSPNPGLKAQSSQALIPGAAGRQSCPHCCPVTACVSPCPKGDSSQRGLAMGSDVMRCSTRVSPPCAPEQESLPPKYLPMELIFLVGLLETRCGEMWSNGWCGVDHHQQERAVLPRGVSCGLSSPLVTLEMLLETPAVGFSSPFHPLCAKCLAAHTAFSAHPALTWAGPGGMGPSAGAAEACPCPQ